MTHVEIVINIKREGEEYEMKRKMDYVDKASACADVKGIMEFISNYVN